MRRTISAFSLHFVLEARVHADNHGVIRLDVVEGELEPFLDVLSRLLVQALDGSMAILVDMWDSKGDLSSEAVTMKKRCGCLLFGLAVALLFSPVPVKALGGSQTPTTPPSGGSSGSARSTPTVPKSSTTRTPVEAGPVGSDWDVRRPIYLTGRVVLEDGTPLPEAAAIERVCNTVHSREGFTDLRGRFNVQLGRSTHVVADASENSVEAGFGGPGLGTMGARQTGNMPDSSATLSPHDLMSCELRAFLPGYRSDVVMLSGRRYSDSPDVGTLVLHRLSAVKGSMLSVTSLNAPEGARKVYEKGRAAIEKKKWQEGQKEMEKAVGLYPQYAAAWFHLGWLLQRQGKLSEAREAYNKCVAADPKYINPYLQLAGLAAKENLWQQVVDTSDRVIEMAPSDFPVAYLYSAAAHYQLKNLGAAEKSAREGLRIDPQRRFPKIGHVLGMVLAQKGDFAGSAEQLRTYLQLAPNAKDVDQVKKQLAELERLAAAPSRPAP